MKISGTIISHDIINEQALINEQTRSMIKYYGGMIVLSLEYSYKKLSNLPN